MKAPITIAQTVTTSAKGAPRIHSAPAIRKNIKAVPNDISPSAANRHPVMPRATSRTKRTCIMVMANPQATMCHIDSIVPTVYPIPSAIMVPKNRRATIFVHLVIFSSSVLDLKGWIQQVVQVHFKK